MISNPSSSFHGTHWRASFFVWKERAQHSASQAHFGDAGARHRIDNRAHKGAGCPRRTRGLGDGRGSGGDTSFPFTSQPQTCSLLLPYSGPQGGRCRGKIELFKAYTAQGQDRNQAEQLLSVYLKTEYHFIYKYAHIYTKCTH